MALPKKRNQTPCAPLVGWVGPVRETWPITPSDGASSNDDAAFFDPPLRMILCTSAGTITYVLDNDDETDTSNKTTETMTLGQRMTTSAIRKVFQTGTTGTFVGYR